MTATYRLIRIFDCARWFACTTTGYPVLLRCVAYTASETSSRSAAHRRWQQEEFRDSVKAIFVYALYSALCSSSTVYNLYNTPQLATPGIFHRNRATRRAGF